MYIEMFKLRRLLVHVIVSFILFVNCILKTISEKMHLLSINVQYLNFLFLFFSFRHLMVRCKCSHLMWCDLLLQTWCSTRSWCQSLTCSAETCRESTPDSQWGRGKKQGTYWIFGEWFQIWFWFKTYLLRKKEWLWRKWNHLTSICTSTSASTTLYVSACVRAWTCNIIESSHQSFALMAC